MPDAANPYAAELDGRDPLVSLEATPRAIDALTRDWGARAFAASYAPGKWSGARILVHLAQFELVMAHRIRMALSTPGYVAQGFDQDAWLPLDAESDGHEALAAYLALRAMPLRHARALSRHDRARTFEHPEYGVLTVDWVLAQLAGHELRHLAQLERIARHSAM